MALKLAKSGDSDSEADSEIFAEINITPLTDIFLVLLIIFMVTSSVMAQLGVNVNLPQASQKLSASQDSGVIITLLPRNEIRIQDKLISVGRWDEMEKTLKEAFAKTRSRLVILEGDRQSFLGSAIEVMDHARIAGAEKFAIATTLEKAAK